MKRIIIYYKYVHVADTDQTKQEMLEVCKKFNLKGRIILAHEGINGTVAGTVEDTKAYEEFLNEHPLFNGMDIKENIVDPNYEYFPRLSIKIRNEIVRLGVDPDKLTVKDTGRHLTPEEVHELLENRPDDLVVLDTRNDYEWAVGHFRDSILPNIKHFRDLPEFIEQNIDTFKDKQVLMHCTAGVRCERATAFLKVKDVAKEVYQIDGGIQRYTEKYPDGHFRGKNYVFDSRITVPINEDVLAECYLCKKPYDEYANCMNALCNKHFIACDDCIESFDNCCGRTCQELVRDKKVVCRPQTEHIRQQKKLAKNQADVEAS